MIFRVYFATDVIENALQVLRGAIDVALSLRTYLHTNMTFKVGNLEAASRPKILQKFKIDRNQNFFLLYNHTYYIKTDEA